MTPKIKPEDLNKVLFHLLKNGEKVAIVIVKDTDVLEDKIDSALLNKCSIFNIEEKV
jgi:hypothetical protein